MSWLSQLWAWAKDSGVGSAVIAASVAVTLFLITRTIEIFGQWRSIRATRRRIVIGLFKEVQANVRSIEAFLDRSPYPGELREKTRRNRAFRPLIIVDETTQFFDSIAASMPDIEPQCLIALSRFYDTIRKEQTVAKAFEAPSFPTLSPDGRASTVDDLWKACRAAEKEGLKALYELELAYPRKWFADFRP